MAFLATHAGWDWDVARRLCRQRSFAGGGCPVVAGRASGHRHLEMIEMRVGDIGYCIVAVFARIGCWQVVTCRALVLAHDVSPGNGLGAVMAGYACANGLTMIKGLFGGLPSYPNSVAIFAGVCCRKMFSGDAQFACGRGAVVTADAASGYVHMVENCTCPGFETHSPRMAICAYISRRDWNVARWFAKGRRALAIVACVAMGRIRGQKVIKFRGAPAGQEVAGAAIVGGDIKMRC